MNTNNPDILFFVRREYGTPSIELRAYKVIIRAIPPECNPENPATNFKSSIAYFIINLYQITRFKFTFL